ncbi:hypothetical protein BGZ60DRAFT_398326 [Tricladium varicosporioides]|nr:hypothetical protein BGZ60DRAFT_398326 [Hymenoscyphus varicosporioides]
MSDPLLSTLCTICHINVPKYKCPRCAVQTCSLPCSRRHKLWSTCTGVRDPTVFMSRDKLLTPSGIDHDYNFLHSIEHRMERAEKEIVEDRGIIIREKSADRRRQNDSGRGKKKSRKGNKPPVLNEAPGEACINKVLQAMRTTILKAPKGMKRNLENTTNWSRKARDINWQVEWIREDDGERILGKAMSNKPLGDFYYATYEEHIKKRLGQEELTQYKKRKTMEHREQVKRIKLDEIVKMKDLTTRPILQNSETSAWDFEPVQETKEDQSPHYKDHFYLLRQNTPASFLKVLVPIDPSKTLFEILRKRTILEFPTIYVYHQAEFPRGFMLEKDFLKATGKPPMEHLNGEISSSNEEDSDSEDTSSSSSSSEGEDVDMEEGEITE